MRLVVDELLPDSEICHYHDNELLILSLHNQVRVEREAGTSHVVVPQSGLRSAVGRSRLARRLLRLDKMNVVPVGERGADLVIVRQGGVYRFEAESAQLHLTLRLRQSRNVLHRGIASLDDGSLYLGEYGANSSLGPVPVYQSRDEGRTWQTVFEFGAGIARHVHGCFYDPVEDRIWIFTGDSAGESHIVVSDRDFRDAPEWLGDGSQMWRACSVFFEEDAVYWLMDSPLEECFVVRLDRRTRKAMKLQPLPGPVWYSARTTDGYYLAATTTEIGPGVKDKFAHIMVSKDAESWTEAARFEHDGLPKRFFKFGIIGFPDGEYSSQEFYIFGEALKGLDGRVARCHLEADL